MQFIPSAPLFLFVVGWDWVFWYCGHYWSIVPAPDDRWWWLWRNWWNVDWQGKPKYSDKTCPSATLSTTNPTWLEPGLNPGRRGRKPGTNTFNYGAAFSAPFVIELNYGIHILYVKHERWKFGNSLTYDELIQWNWKKYIAMHVSKLSKIFAEVLVAFLDFVPWLLHWETLQQKLQKSFLSAFH
jgi:hypothetical protein